jgi:hypothetical protein
MSALETIHYLTLPPPEPSQIILLYIVPHTSPNPPFLRSCIPPHSDINFITQCSVGSHIVLLLFRGMQISRPKDTAADASRFRSLAPAVGTLDRIHGVVFTSIRAYERQNCMRSAREKPVLKRRRPASSTNSWPELVRCSPYPLAVNDSEMSYLECASSFQYQQAASTHLC